MKIRPSMGGIIDGALLPRLARRGSSLIEALPRLTKTADNSDDAQKPQHVIGDIHLPPFQSLTRAGHVLMMVVMPAFAEGDQREQKIVSAVVFGFESPGSPEVSEGIYRERAMPEHNSGQHESPHEDLEATDCIHRGPEQDRRNPVVSIQQSQFGILLKVLHEAGIIGIGGLGYQPSHMRPPESLTRGRMGIRTRVGIPVMCSMMRSPPEDAFLRTRLGQEAQEELADAPQLKRSVAEVPVIPGGDGEHANRIGCDEPADIRTSEGHPKQEKARKVEGTEGNNGVKVESSDGRHQPGGTFWRFHQQHERRKHKAKAQSHQPQPLG
jgi:hypothetical protein